ncbi:hypothetical protein [Neorhizobium galegae]|uniref:Uncharacterized protein n=1 Tax=Neorhizobium galegae bv. orientalis str. HAMBI 540 TaxID=1028800 RepID=A0A068SUG2_NEOGA|nr:hypothetical protein [Neorhizobium galegae]CDN49519.1 Hypothetical protein RG540_CH33550 [Neorhizobium galegae bv. orientalis str. HAMBI 540]CDZ46981.1 Hypothetical protein NGAL_HAMBI2427_19530 [Neorhizobium galegae bv. orientalis]
MNIHSQTRSDRREMQGENSQRQMAGGLWKLLSAAILILLGLIVAMEALGDGNNGFVAPNPAQQTVLE